MAEIKKPAAKNAKPLASGFVNIYLPGKTGRRKLGSIFLFDEQPGHKSLREWLEADPTRIEVLKAQAEFEYNPNVPESDKEFVLPE